jgi:hypothetical protein
VYFEHLVGESGYYDVVDDHHAELTARLGLSYGGTQPADDRGARIEVSGGFFDEHEQGSFISARAISSHHRLEEATAV